MPLKQLLRLKMRRCFFLVLFLIMNFAPAKADDQPMEYTDNEYHFGFQLPSTWKLQQTPSPGDTGEVRAIIKHPTKFMYVTALVGQLDKKISREAFVNSTHKEAVEQA